MLKERILLKGDTGDDIKSAIPIAINKASTIGESVFLNWNGVTIKVSPDSTEDEILKEYKRGIHLIELGRLEDKNELIDKYQLCLKIADYITKLINN